MPEFKIEKQTQEEYDADHRALLGQIAALRTALGQLQSTTGKRTPGTVTPFVPASGGATSGGTSPAAPSASTIMVSDGTTQYTGVPQVTLPSWTLSQDATTGTVTANLGGIIDM